MDKVLRVDAICQEGHNMLATSRKAVWEVKSRGGLAWHVAKVPAGGPRGFDSTSRFHSYSKIPTKIWN